MRWGKSRDVPGTPYFSGNINQHPQANITGFLIRARSSEHQFDQPMAQKHRTLTLKADHEKTRLAAWSNSSAKSSSATCRRIDRCKGISLSSRLQCGNKCPTDNATVQPHLVHPPGPRPCDTFVFLLDRFAACDPEVSRLSLRKTSRSVWCICRQFF